ncbi:MAG: ADP-ribosylglycohydrolase family protein [Saprospiraceae bacterium]|nr:ADP-ribosylglycohydrolase family protein [Saprospiraceae bacterium]
MNWNKMVIINQYYLVLFLLICACSGETRNGSSADENQEIIISRSAYKNQLYGFWLGQCIANWTGLITEMDKIGGNGKDGNGAGFYTRASWGGPDDVNMWGSKSFSDTIDFFFADEGEIWGADDDTDIEYIYLHLLLDHNTAMLTPRQIAEGWINHIRKEEENYLWVSNQTAFDLMQTGILPPETSDPANNPNYEMIDAQLTTEIFGLLAPGRPGIALKMAELPIRTTARENAQWIAEFYVIMHSLACLNQDQGVRDRLFWMADEARKHLPATSYSAKMYDFVKSQYQSGLTWEKARDALYEKYQVRQEDGYEWPSKEPVCHGCFAAGINFGASMVSLFYGEGDLKETIKIGVLCGWDSDNPTATWGGLIGFMLGKDGVEKAFGRKFSSQFNIHRTRIGFSDGGIDNFSNMAEKGLRVIDQVVTDEIQGKVDKEENVWRIPQDRNTAR